MKNQLVSPFKSAALGVLVLTLWCLLSACSGAIEGTVFLDTDGDQQLDDNEVGLPYVKMALSVDGEKVVEGLTMGNGGFRVKHNGKKSKSTACVKVDQTSADTIVASLSSFEKTNPLSAKAVIGAKALPTTTTPATDTPDQTTTDAEKEKTDEEKKKADDAKKAEEEKKAEEAAQIGYVDGKGFCFPIKNGQGQGDVPVGIDWLGTLSDRPTPPNTKHKIDETFKQQIFVPKGSHLKPFFAPNYLDAVGDPEAGVEVEMGTSLVSVAATPPLKKSMTKAAESNSVATTLEVITLTFHVSETLPYGDTDVDLDLKAVTPSGAEVKLPTISYTLVHKPEVEFESNLTGDQVIGGEIAIEITIKNKGNSDILNAKLSVSVPNDVHYIGETVDGDGCTFLGNLIECSGLNLFAGSAHTKKFVLRLPGAIVSDETKTFEPSLTVEDYDKPIKGSPSSFLLKKPQ